MDHSVDHLVETKDGTVINLEKGHTLVLSSGIFAWKRLQVGGGVDTDEAFTISRGNWDRQMSFAGSSAFGEPICVSRPLV